MQRLRRGDISFFRLSLSCPKIFSTHAVSCCLNNMAGYLASTCGRVSLRPTNFEGDLSVWKKHKYCYSSQKAKSILNDFFRRKKISGDKDYLVPKLNEKQLCLCTTYKTMKTDNILNKNVFMSPDNILTLHPKMTNATSTIRLQKS